MKRSPQDGVKVLLFGPPGSGKTTCLRQAVTRSGLELFGLMMEPGHSVLTGQNTVEPYTEEDLRRVHWRYIPTSAKSWDPLINQADLVNRVSASDLLSITADRDQHRQFLEVLKTCASFKDQTGRDFGPVDSWSTKRILVLDNLTSLCKTIRGLALGSRTGSSQPELYMMQDNIQRFLDRLVEWTHCHVVLLAHVEFYQDENSMGRRSGSISVRGIGRALAHVMGRNWTDVIYAERTNGAFVWRTDHDEIMGLKANNVPWAKEMPQSFASLIDWWQSRGGIIEEEEEEGEESNQKKLFEEQPKTNS